MLTCYIYSMETNNPNLIWIDCEFTSIDFDTNELVEVAVVVTDSDLNVLGKPVSVVIHHQKDVLDSLLNDWTREHFAESGLIDQIAESEVTMDEAEQAILEYVRKFTEPGQSPLCGNSVGQDRRVLYKDMPELEEHFHYRNIDVSTLKELSLRWNPLIQEHIDKQGSHRALDDIMESIEELRVYREEWLDK